MQKIRYGVTNLLACLLPGLSGCSQGTAENENLSDTDNTASALVGQIDRYSEAAKAKCARTMLRAL